LSEPSQSPFWFALDDPALSDEVRRRASGWSPESMRKSGFEPATVIDVGAAHGTPPLYDAFPDAYHVLIDPLREYEQSLRQRLSEVEGEHVVAAIGDREETATINVALETLWTSSLMRPRWGLTEDGDQVEQRDVEMTTLDRLVEQRGWAAPFGIKIDTEGYEDRVIRGASSLLQRTQFVVAEVSVAPRFEGGYSFADFIALMDEHGFALCDILDGIRPRKDRCVAFIDACFKRRK
jgi:FkbM family methyltransferase